MQNHEQKKVRIFKHYFEVLLHNGFLRLGYLSTILKCIRNRFKNRNG
jgi:hypothetical protein